VDAVHHFKIVFEYSGGSSFAANFATGTLFNFSAIPFFGGNGIGFRDLEYDRLEYTNFCKSAVCATGFGLHLCFEEKVQVVRVQYEKHTHLKFIGYTVE
jgi:hypothetical protein